MRAVEKSGSLVSLDVLKKRCGVPQRKTKSTLEPCQLHRNFITETKGAPASLFPSTHAIRRQNKSATHVPTSSQRN